MTVASKNCDGFLLMFIRSVSNINSYEHLFPAIHSNKLRSSPISISIGATLSRETLFIFYYAID